MSPLNLLLFNSSVGKQKMDYTVNLNDHCPFCDRSNLKDILAEDGPIILVKNKYLTLENSYQTVLIETDDCKADFSTYSKEHLYRVIRFGVNNWLQMERSGDFSSVLFFKNHGPLSGGSISHEHMQIVGLKNIDYRDNFVRENFLGIIINRHNTVEFNLSTAPRIGFYEFNVILQNMSDLNQMAEYIQIAVHYLLNHFNNCTSYNIFFYSLGETIYVKIIPRFVTSPLFVGYSLVQVSDLTENLAQRIRRLYFN